MKIAYIGTYPPRKCGIGTFTNNLLKAIVSNIDSKKISKHAMVVAINENANKLIYPEEVKYVIRKNHQPDYVLVKHRGLEKYVYFSNEFATEVKLFEYLNACDIYITSYLISLSSSSGISSCGRPSLFNATLRMFDVVKPGVHQHHMQSVIYIFKPQQF